MSNQSTQNSGSNQPSHILYHVEQDGSDNGFWRKVGAAWAQRDGKGFSVQLDYLPINSAGRFVLRVTEPKPEQATDTA